MPNEKPTLRQEIMSADEIHCDKGPVLDKIVDAIDNLDKRTEKSEKNQEKMVDALSIIAAQNERIISLADKTDRNQQDIQHLFKLNRENEKQINAHIMSPRHTPSGQPDIQIDTATKSKAAKFDKIETALITGALMGVVGFLWQFIKTVMNFMQISGGTP